MTERQDEKFRHRNKPIKFWKLFPMNLNEMLPWWDDNVLQIEINWKFSIIIDSISIPILNVTLNLCGFYRFDFFYRTNDHAIITWIHWKYEGMSSKLIYINIRCSLLLGFHYVAERKTYWELFGLLSSHKPRCRNDNSSINE